MVAHLEPSERAPISRKTWTTRAFLAVLAAGSLLLMLPAVAPSAHAAPAGSALVPAATSNNTQQWAYGATHALTASGSGTDVRGMAYEYQLHAFFGWVVIITQTNTSSSAFQLELQRTAASSVFVQVCAPSCPNANYTLNYTIRSTEQVSAFSNFTRDASVNVSGQPVPALGLENAQGFRHTKLAATFTLTGAHGSLLQSRTLNAVGESQAQVTFSPSLGLIPDNVTAGSSWSSSSAFNLTGNYSLAVKWTIGGQSGSANPSGNLSENGTVSLWGIDAGAAGGHLGSAQRIVLNLSGAALDVHDGIILLPREGDAMSGDWGDIPDAGWTPGITESAATTEIDYEPGAAHFGLVGSVSSVASSTPSTSDTPAFSPALTGSAQSAGPAPTNSSVQSEPLTISAAEALAQQLLGLGPTRGSGFSVLAVALVVGVVALIVGTVATVGSRRGPRTPPPVRVPATAVRVSLPPPGALAGVPPQGPPPPPRDPLDNLW
jgi:hypothetical protein